MEETLTFPGSSVEKAVGVRASVEVGDGLIDGLRVGGGVNVAMTAGTCVPPQAASRKKKRIGAFFFIGEF